MRNVCSQHSFGAHCVRALFAVCAIAVSACAKFPGFLTNPPDTNTIVGVATLSFSGQDSIYEGECNAVPILLFDSADNQVKAPDDLSISLSNDQGASFFSDSLCTQVVTATSIAAGGTSASVFLKTAAPGPASIVLTAREDAGGVQSEEKTFPIVTTANLILSDGPSYNFGDVSTGVYADKTFTLSNTGGSTATAISAAAMVSAFSYVGGSFPGTGGNCTTSLSAGNSCSLVVRFAPSAIASASSAITLSYNQGVSVRSVSRALTGTGLGSPVKLIVSGTANQISGFCGTFTAVSSDVNNLPASVTSTKIINLSGAGTGAFYSDSACSSTTTSVSIASGLSAATFYYKNSSPSSVTLQAADAGAVLTSGNIAVSVSNAAFLTISDASSYSFGSIAQSTTINHIFSLTNSGLLTASAISAPTLPSPFIFTGGSFPGTGGNCGSTLAAGTSCTFDVTFAPTAVGSSSCSVSIVYNNGSSVEVASRSATGTAVGTPTQVSLTGTTTPTAGLCYAYTVTTQDSGASAVNALSTISVTLSGGGAGAFYSDASCTSSTTNVSVVAGTPSATVYFKDSTAQALTLSVSPSGGLTLSTLAVTVLSQASLSFSVGSTYTYSSEYVNSSITHTFTLTNSGQVAATSVSTSGLSAPFSFAGGSFPGTGGTCTTTLAPATSCTLEISFAPTAAVTYSGTLLMPYNNGVDLTVLSLSFSGLGVTPTQSLNLARGFSDTVNAIRLAPSGNKLVVVGDFTVYESSTVGRIARINPDFTIDSTFNTGGAGTNGSITAIAPIGDGSSGYYLAGSFSTYNGTTVRSLIRINANGVLDTGFNVTALVSGSVSTIAVVDRGSGVHQVYVGGTFTSINGTSQSRISRLNSDGTVDSSFAIGTGFDAAVTKIAVAPGSTPRVYAAGTFTAFNGSAALKFAGITDGGVLDSGFTQCATMSANAEIQSMMVATDSKIYLGGFISAYNGTTVRSIFRLTSSGIIDSAFAPPTMGTASYGYGVTDIFYDSDSSGNIFAMGLNSVGSFSVPQVTLLTPTGSVVSLPVYNSVTANSTNMMGAVASDGSVYLAGNFTAFGGAGRNRIAKLTSSRAIDSSVPSGSGLGTFSSTNRTVYSTASLLDGSNRVYAVGMFASFNGQLGSGVIRIKPDSTYDTSFISSNVSFTVAKSIAETASGRVYVGGGFTTFNGNAANRIIALNSDGTVDSGFAYGGGFNNAVNVVTLQPNGTGVYVGGSFTGYQNTTANCIVRLNSDGSIDTGFNSGTGFDAYVNGIAPVGDGTNDVYVWGTFTNYNGNAVGRIIRLNEDGSIDTSFATGTGFSAQVYSAAVISGSGGKIYVGSASGSYNGNPARSLVRLAASGSLDSGFTPLVFAGSSAYVGAIALADDGSGDVYAGGSFLTYNGVSSPRLVRLNNDGTLDTGFAVGTGFEGTVFTIMMSPDGTHKPVVGGAFTTYNGTVTDQLVRLTTTGGLD
jgi:uncharacterized delta-60 repeat protein